MDLSIIVWDIVPIDKRAQKFKRGGGIGGRLETWIKLVP
jgi:hypothetical protein